MDRTIHGLLQWVAYAPTDAAPPATLLARFKSTLRQRVSRLVREILSCSKTFAQHIGASKDFICHDNLIRAAVTFPV